MPCPYSPNGMLLQYGINIFPEKKILPDCNTENTECKHRREIFRSVPSVCSVFKSSLWPGWGLAMLTDTGIEPAKGLLEAKLEQVEREMIVEALRLARGKRARAARALGITERIMGLRIRKYRIDSRQFRTRL